MSPPQLDPSFTGGGGGGATAAAAVAVVAGDELKETELRLGLPGSDLPEKKASLTLDLLPAKSLVSGAKRGFSDTDENREKGKEKAQEKKAGPANGVTPVAKAQVVGWPPIRSYRKNTMATTSQSKIKEESENADVAKQETAAATGGNCLYVKVSMDGAPYLRKVDLKMYSNYKDLSSALENMFSGFTRGGSHGKAGKEESAETRTKDLLNGSGSGSGSEYVLTYEDKDGDWMLVGDVPWEMFTDTCRRLRIMKGSDAIGLAPRAKNQN